MSKKKRHLVSIGLGPIGGNTDGDGFVRMEHKKGEKPKRTLNIIGGDTGVTRRPSKLVAAAANTVAVKVYDQEPMLKMLDELTTLVKDGKYGKALAAVNRNVMDEFLEEFKKDRDFAADEDHFLGMVRQLINICKSFYEYDEKQREVMDNITYDWVLARFLANGGNEPYGIVPRGSRNLKKTDIRYATLHNNVDKCYTVYQTDPVPDGVKETDSIEAFLNRVYTSMGMSSEKELTIEVSPKIDGVSVNGTIQGDILIDPQTRGDKDESIAAMGINGIQVSIGHEAENSFGIQYELFVTEEDRVKASEYLGLARPYVSCRHAASGILRRLCTEENNKLLEFVSLYPIASEGLGGTYVERMDYLSNFGIVPEDMISRTTITGNMEKLLRKIKSKFAEFEGKRETLSYAIDGMVLTLVDDEQQATLGRDNRTNKFQIALKFDPASAVATVRGITLDSGNKGFRTIQVELDHPIFLDGVRYDHVPVLSARLYDNLNLRRGSQVNVHRVGDVNPAISVMIEGHGDKLTLPKFCPACHAPLNIRDEKLYCDNSECRDNIVGRFLGFLSKLGMDGYGESFCTTLRDKLGCKSIADMLKLTSDDLRVAGVNSDKVDKFPDELKKAIGSHRDFEILGAIGLPGIGNQKAKKLLAVVPFSELSNGKRPDYERLVSASYAAVGSRMSLYVATVLASDMIRADLKALGHLVTKITEDFNSLVRVGHSGANLSSEMIKLVHDLGFEVVDGKAFDILIVPNMDHTSNKVKIADGKNLPIMTEELFKVRYADDIALISAS